LKSEFKMQKDHWTIFYKLFMTQFKELDSKVMEAVGVSVNLLIKKNRGERASYDVTTNQIEQNARRFYLALILRDLIKEVPPSEVEAKFQFSLVSIEKLQELSSMFASMASVMCERLGWTDLAGLINKFQSRVLSGAGAEILSLTEIPGMKTIKARILYKAQIRSPEDVVQCATEHIAQVLARSASKYKGNERISNKCIFAIESKAAKSIMRGAQELIERKKEELQKQVARYNNITGQSLTADSTLEDPSLVKKKGLKELKTMEQLEKLHVHLKESCTNISLMLYSRNVEVVAQHRTSLGLKGTPDRKDIYSQQDATEEKLLGITLCFSPRAVVYLPLFKSDGSSYGDDKGDGFQARVWELLVFILGREELKKATWDWKPQLKVLKRACLSLGAEWRDPKICQCYDMRIAAWLLSPDDEEIKDTLSLRWRGLETVTKRYTTLNSAVYSCIGKGERSMGEGTLVFACRNTARTYDVFDPLLKKLESEDLVDSFVRIEMALVPVLAEMETKRVPFDAEVYKASLPSINALLAQLAEKAWVEAGTIFNISSPSDVSRILFQVLRLDPIPGSVSKSSSKKRQYINISTKAEYLEQLSSEHPLPKTILKHRQLSRLLQEMSVTLPDCSIQSASQIMVSCSVNSNGKQVHMNRIKGHFLQTSSSTGRLAMDEPNLQKVPREKKISLGTSQEVLEGSSKVSNFNPRLAFTSISEFVILSADYAQLELRLMAHFSQDPVLLEAIKQGQRDRKKDFFTLLASRWQGIPTEVVTNDVRDKAKRLTYGILYGMGPERLSVELKCDIAKAQEQANAFKVCLGGVTHWIAGTLKKVEKQGFVETLGGRKRYFPLLAAAGKGKNVNFGNKAQEERQAINTVCQGSAADIVKAAMVDIHKQLQNDKKLGSRCHMIHMIHDELLFEVRRTCLDQAALLVKESMERSWKEALTVPLEARLQVGDSWGSMDVYNTTE
jgi:DNA polymerase theta